MGNASDIYDALVEHGPLTFETSDGVVVTADGYWIKGEEVGCTARAWWNGTDELPVDNPYSFVNPPIVVADGSSVHDPLAAFAECLGTVVVEVAKSLGWSR